MIIDWYSESAYDAPVLYLRTRGSDGVLHERYIRADDEDYVRPFCWVDQASPTHVLRRMQRLNATIHYDEVAQGLYGNKLWKVSVSHPNTLWQLKDRCDRWTHEADVSYQDQVLMKLYPDEIPDFQPRKWYYDLEWNPNGDNDYTTVMAVVDTDMEHPVVFAWNEHSNLNNVYKTEWIDRYDGYELRTFPNEHKMHDGFLSFLEERDPDILIAHAGHWADLPHLHKRLGVERERMSPLNIFIAPPKDGSGYKTTRQPIKGRLVYDTAAQWTDGTGFEAIWQKSGKGQAESRKLDWFAKQLGFAGKLTNDIQGMTVFNGWTDYYDDFVDYCLVDTTLLRDCDEKLHCTDFHVALQKVCGVQFASTHKVTRYFRGLIGRRTELKAPSSFVEERPELEAAWVMTPVPGRHENVALKDFASLYPNIILSANLCWTTLVDEGGEGILTLNIPPKRDKDGTYIEGTGGTYHWDQTTEGLFPKVVKELLALRKEYKTLMKEATNPDEKLGYNMLQMAVKVAVNALYGMTGTRKISGQWSNYAIAQSITYLGRRSITMLVDECEKRGYKALAGHTDSVYVQVPFDEAQGLCDELTTIAQEDMNLAYLDVEFEAFFPYWFTANMKNRNFGIKSFPPEEEGQMKVTGYSLKASNAPAITKEILSTAFTLIGNGANEDEVFEQVRPLIKQLYKGERDVQEIASSGRISKHLHEYDKVVPNPAKAARYSNLHLQTNFNKGDSIRWVFIDGVPEGQPMCNVVAFEEPHQLEGYSIDWTTTVEKWIRSKIKSVYETLYWNLDALTDLRVPKRYGW